MKLLQLTTIPETLEAFMLPFARHFGALGWTVEGGARDATSNEAVVSTFDAVHDIGWSRNPVAPSNFTAGAAIRRLVAAGSYDLVHVHTPVAGFITRLALRNCRSRPAVVYTAHGFHFYEGGNPLKNAVFRSLERAAGPWTDRLVVINQEDREAALKYSIVPAERLDFVPGIGVDLEDLKRLAAAGPSRHSQRQQLGIPSEAPVFLMVAEYNPGKRHVDVVSAFAELDSEVPAYLMFAGRGPQRPAIESMVKTMGLSDRVRFLGYRRDVPSLINASDALVLVSDREGLPRSIMEAMALERPVIGTNIRGVSDLLSDGAGLVVPVGDVVAITQAMTQLAESPQQRSVLAEEARKRVERYSLPAVLQSHEAIYEKALRARGLVEPSN